ncbi:winged helix DNA-binding protein [Halobacteria archaeon AArc-curdl1]|uniref:Winged helix DNA-binding protein n=1 Tax=Natronosalvus hydrolyticus TaxID=2979988 RepID=A0AAP3E7B1_9EURY|nr:winged helix DNA-binding protein [Halobacteria archaeon AArc-curdl1]
MTDDTQHNENIFLKEKPCKILIEISNPQTNSYPSDVAKAADTTLSHTITLIQEMENMGLVKSEKTGRKKMLKLTKEGKTVAKPLSTVLAQLDG